MLLDPLALAWVSWIGLGVGIVGTLISLVGLGLTFREARNAKLAASSARQEVEKVLELTRSRSRLSALSSAVSQADMISQRIDKDALRSSRDAFTAFSRAVHEALATVPSAESQLGRKAGDEVDAALKSILRLIGEQVDSKMKKAQMHALMSEVSGFLLRQEALVRAEDP